MTTASKPIPSVNEHVRHVRSVLDVVIDRLDDPPPLAELAELSGYSPFHFHRVFRGLVGEPVAGLVRRLRLERAAIALRDRPDESVIEVALAAGYETHEAFTRAFRAAFGRSPTQFRRARPACVWLAGPSRLHVDDETGEVVVPDPLAGLSNEEQTMILRTENRQPTRIAYIAGRGAYPKVLPASFERLCDFARRKGLFARPGAVTLAVCHDDPEITPEHDIRSEAAITVVADFQPEGEVRVRELPGGKYACATFLGPYSGLQAAWAEVCGQLIPQAGLRFRSGECFEVYVNDPNSVAPEQIRTDIYVPVE